MNDDASPRGRIASPRRASAAETGSHSVMSSSLPTAMMHPRAVATGRLDVPHRGSLPELRVAVDADGTLKQPPSQLQLEQHEHTDTIELKPRAASLNTPPTSYTNGSNELRKSTPRESSEEEDDDEGEIKRGGTATEENIFFLKRMRSAAGSITSNGQTIDVEELVTEMAHPITGVSVKDRKHRLKSHKQCFVGAEAVDWLVGRLAGMDRDDAVSLGQELLRLQFFSPVSDDCRSFSDDVVFYVFMIRPRPDKSAQVQSIRSLDHLAAAAMDSLSGVAVQDRKYHFKTYPNCFVGSELVDWLMSNLPLRSRDEAEKLGQKLMRKGYITHVTEDKPFKDDILFYRFIKIADGSEQVGREKEVTLHDFELLKVIGVGAFGRVLMIRKRDTGQVYAMKALDKQEVAVSERAIRNLKSERNILRNDHPFLVHLHYSFQTEEKLYLVMDYLSGGDMFFHLRKKGRFTEKEAQFFAAEITLGLEHLHSFGIIYRDLKPENVLFDKDGHVCLTDFGISKEVGELKTKTLCGTPSYLAPEILKGEEYGQSVDWWSVGVLILEMVTGKNPFRSKNIHQTMQWIMKKPLAFPEFLDIKTVDVITRLLSRDPNARLGCGVTGAREVKCHPFFKGINWTELAVKKVKSPLKIAIKTETDTSYFSSEFTKMSLEEIHNDAGRSRQREYSDSPSPDSTAADAGAFPDWSHSTPNLL